MQDLSTFHAIARFGLGAAPGEAEHVSSDPRGWLMDQVRRGPVDVAGGPFAQSADLLADIHKARIQGPEQLREKTRGYYRSVFWPEITARARHAVTTDRPYAERLALFWSNHFTISRTRALIGPAIPAYEREAIRSHVFGRFADMLKAACMHACMVSYLDNMTSIGPNSPVGRRRLRRNPGAKTLNENLAREILELHTLGVNGGYGQQDVIELAKAITGWSHGGLRPKQDTRPVHGGFEFKPAFHEPGPKTVLGKRYPEAGAEEGLTILDDLARHPATARHVATKLCRHFVSDEPPASAVERVARVFQETHGDLGRVAQALVDLPEAWAAPLAKVKSHYEYVVGVLRAFGGDIEEKTVAAPLQTLGQPPFSAPSPQGWGDTAQDWVAPEALMRRIEWSRSHARRVRSVAPAQFMDETVGPAAGATLINAVALAPSADAGAALVLASPEFQRR